MPINIHEQNGQCSSSKLGLYCHVPFCANNCAYCAFYKERPTAQLIQDYIKGINIEEQLLEQHKPFDTIYVGGGTPGILVPEKLDTLCRILKRHAKQKLDEFSIELSPNTVTTEKLQILKSHRCNRITMGVQSFNANTLKALGRRQQLKQTLSAYSILRNGPIKNIGIDLIFGAPGQTIKDWLSDLETAVSLDPDHISTYNLTFEDDTPLTTALNQHIIDKKTCDTEAEFYLQTCHFLEQKNYKQYEISNFSKPGKESIHNINTWNMQEWIGIGPSACSQYRNTRFQNPHSLNQWLTKIKNHTLAHDNMEKISQQKLAEDCIIFGLRLSNGINIKHLQQRFRSIDFDVFEPLWQQLLNEHLANYYNNIIKLTEKGRLVADAIATEIIGKLDN